MRLDGDLSNRVPSSSRKVLATSLSDGGVIMDVRIRTVALRFKGHAKAVCNVGWLLNWKKVVPGFFVCAWQQHNRVVAFGFHSLTHRGYYRLLLPIEIQTQCAGN